MAVFAFKDKFLRNTDNIPKSRYSVKMEFYGNYQEMVKVDIVCIT